MTNIAKTRRPSPASARSRRTKLEVVAHHEAGHVAVAIQERISFHNVSIVADAYALGRVQHRRLSRTFIEALKSGSLTRDQVEKHVLYSLAGPAAETRFTGRDNARGAEQDRDTAIDLLMGATGSGEEVSAWFNLMEIRARLTIERSWEQIEAIAAALLERKTMTARAVRAFLRDWDARKFAALTERLNLREPAQLPDDGQMPSGLTEVPEWALDANIDTTLIRQLVSREP
jgi:hypothetical protein